MVSVPGRFLVLLLLAGRRLFVFISCVMLSVGLVFFCHLLQRRPDFWTHFMAPAAGRLLYGVIFFIFTHKVLPSMINVFLVSLFSMETPQAASGTKKAPPGIGQGFSCENILSGVGNKVGFNGFHEVSGIVHDVIPQDINAADLAVFQGNGVVTVLRGIRCIIDYHAGIQPAVSAEDDEHRCICGAYAFF